MDNFEKTIVIKKLRWILLTSAIQRKGRDLQYGKGRLES